MEEVALSDFYSSFVKLLCVLMTAPTRVTGCVILSPPWRDGSEPYQGPMYVHITFKFITVSLARTGGK